jgi:DNA polymerase-3 subunit delta
VETWNKAEQSILEKYLKRPNRSACLVLQVTTKKSSEALISAVKKAGGVVLEFPTPSEVELPRWLQEQASLLQKQLSLQAATLLLERSGTDLHRLAHEVEKLCDFVGERNRIELADIDHVVCYQRQYTIFELVRSVGKCQAGRAITILRQLLLAGEAPLSILGLLARHFRILWQVQDGLRRGLAVDTISDKIKLSSWLLRKEYLPNAMLYSTAMLFRAHRKLEAMDLLLKTSGGTPEAILETLVLSLCRLQQKGSGATAQEPGKPASK